MPLFLSHPTPAEVAVRGGRASLIRPRIEPTEFLDRQTDPDWQSGGAEPGGGEPGGAPPPGQR